jgi:hypothetical protein
LVLVFEDAKTGKNACITLKKVKEIDNSGHSSRYIGARNT